MHMSPLVRNSLGRRYNLHQLINGGNHYLEQPHNDDFVLNKPFFKFRIFKRQRVIHEGEMTIDVKKGQKVAEHVT